MDTPYSSINLANSRASYYVLQWAFTRASIEQSETLLLFQIEWNLTQVSAITKQQQTFPSWYGVTWLSPVTRHFPFKLWRPQTPTTVPPAGMEPRRGGERKWRMGKEGKKSSTRSWESDVSVFQNSDVQISKLVNHIHPRICTVKF